MPIASRALTFDDRTGTAPRVVDTQVGEPGPGQIRVRMTAAGICHSDLHTINGDWPMGRRLVLGHEGAGVVDQVGPGVTGLAPGDPVALNWYVACQACPPCRQDKPWLCTGSPALENQLPDGTTAVKDPAADDPDVWPFLGVGAFSEYAVVPETAAVRLPPEVPPHIAALIGCSVTTGYGAVHRTVSVAKGDAIVVTGCGGVGQAIIAAAADAGAGPIIAVDRSASRLEAARELGATHTILADGTEVDQALTICPDGVTYAFDAIGIPDVAARAPRFLTAGGTAVLVGMPAIAATAPIDTWDVVTRGLTVVGCNYGSAVPARDFPLIAEAYLTGRLPLDRLVGGSVTLDAAADAINALTTAVGGRTIVTFDH
ncbi:S-(hydroxymethyl)glutathione dehydrogenase/alcohol dehydrogenase [Actinoplanes lutulentus]|uniref:S-(Hydroxymethyl)glutathione dehydrogenase/alcohol dehydrogenase n=1 Tax=Actinoplanes lutulentus TaxID=1287878 RepID=A0A327YZG8_9ACTN|nr:alcohol dehydrogenase catalytic domain-containing protein [Actinoplanes lutulentus]MBB2946565.1 S-(hydroxymethyl)glutathione dehydrogenase/alcohol dehydrogenase [Actinoplanes lutulentus]RAK26483.1 S-(hydroxymethyl)glutathione dehydrogenase/alcohol dehydrogenase [Actinoplanes lutulentus]